MQKALKSQLWVEPVSGGNSVLLCHLLNKLLFKISMKKIKLQCIQLVCSIFLNWSKKIGFEKIHSKQTMPESTTRKDTMLPHGLQLQLNMHFVSGITSR